MTKPREYAQAGIPEYWIVDPQTESITVLALDSGSVYVETAVCRSGEAAESALLDGFRVDVAAVLTPE